MKNSRGENFAKFHFAVDIIFAGGKFRAKSKFGKIAKIYSTRKIGVIQYTAVVLLSRVTVCRRAALIVTMWQYLSYTLVDKSFWLSHCS